MAEFGLSSSAMRRINTRIRQRESTTGRRVRSSELTAIYEAELNVASGRAIEGARFAESKRQFDVSTAEGKRRFDEQQERLKGAGTAKFFTDAAGLAIAAREPIGDVAANLAFGRAPFAKPTSTTISGGASVVPAATSTATPGVAAEGIGVTTGTALEEIGGFTVSGAQTAVTGTELAAGVQTGVAEGVGATATEVAGEVAASTAAAGETAVTAAPALSSAGVAISGAVGGFLGAELGEQEWFQDITPWGGETTERVIAGAAGGAVSAFAAGAALGTPAGPIGVLIGGIIGGFIGLFG